MFICIDGVFYNLNSIKKISIHKDTMPDNKCLYKLMVEFNDGVTPLLIVYLNYINSIDDKEKQKEKLINLYNTLFNNLGKNLISILNEVGDTCYA